jgi:hypothetical protein
MDEPQRRVLKPAGPIAQAYGQCKAPVAVCVGPTGGGKTTESVRRIRRVAQWQHPSPRDGVRKARILCVAPTYRRIWDQVLPSYFKEVDRQWGTEPGVTGFRGARGDPADHFFAFQTSNSAMHYVEVLFRAVGDLSLEEFFRGFECTAVWLPEMDTHETEDILSLGANRCGRYPEPDDRPDDPELEPAYNGVYGDANAPVIGSWFFDRFYLRRKATDRVFKQPGGLLPGGPPYITNPRAENLQNLRKIDPNYYPKKALDHDKWAIRRLLESRPGYARDGEPVHEDFDVDKMGIEGGIEPVRGVELIIGADCGNTLWPSATFAQRIMGQVRCMAEVAPKDTMDIQEFGAEIRRLKETRFAQVERATLWVDPSASARSAMNQHMSYAQMLQGATGIEVRLAPSNKPSVRISALNAQLRRAGPPGEPGFLIDKDNCPETVLALSGGYRFPMRNGKRGETPEKNIHSHRAEAGQYMALGMDGLTEVGGGFIHGGGASAEAQHSPILAE